MKPSNWSHTFGALMPLIALSSLAFSSVAVSAQVSPAALTALERFQSSTPNAANVLHEEGVHLDALARVAARLGLASVKEERTCGGQESWVLALAGLPLTAPPAKTALIYSGQAGGHTVFDGVSFGSGATDSRMRSTLAGCSATHMSSDALRAFQAVAAKLSAGVRGTTHLAVPGLEKLTIAVREGDGARHAEANLAAVTIPEALASFARVSSALAEAGMSPTNQRRWSSLPSAASFHDLRSEEYFVQVGSSTLRITAMVAVGTSPLAARRSAAKLYFDLL